MEHEKYIFKEELCWSKVYNEKYPFMMTNAKLLLVSSTIPLPGACNRFSHSTLSCRLDCIAFGNLHTFWCS